MNVGDCYRLLELDRGATIADVKAAYRRLARLHHPDLSDRANAHERFIALQAAYQKLCATLPPISSSFGPAPSSLRDREPVRSAPPHPDPPPVTAPPATTPPPPRSRLSDLERQLKRDAYEKLRSLLGEERFPRAIAIVEGLAERIPNDPEVRQWQAVTYQCCGRDCLDREQFVQARKYLMKAYRTDPHNRELLGVVSQDLRRLERLCQHKRQRSGGGHSFKLPEIFKTRDNPDHLTVRPTPTKKRRKSTATNEKGTAMRKPGPKRSPKRASQVKRTSKRKKSF